ncbi:MAG: DoxX family protein [Nitrososphaerota archaeon]|nr:DoxX family protein [Candidatus Calditenuaceae archaeon]MDW8073510.1 DoxX family protein [Nitrososphaerota archaeon]
MFLGFLEVYTDAALLVVRVFLGMIMIVHGIPKIVGPARAQMRAGMSQLGIHPILFDLVGLLEFFGGILLIAGLLTRLVSLLFALQMVGTIILYISVLGRFVPPPEMLSQMVANSRRVMRGFVSGVGGWEFDLLILGVAILLLIIGGGALSLDSLIGL